MLDVEKEATRSINRKAWSGIVQGIFFPGSESYEMKHSYWLTSIPEF